MSVSRVALSFLLGWLAFGSDTSAGEPAVAEAEDREASGVTLGYDNLLVVRYNTLGLKDDFDLHLRRELLDGGHILTTGTYVGALLHTSFSPAAIHLGLGAELMPLAVLRLKAIVEWVPFFGTFDNVQSFPSPTAEHSDTERDRLGNAGAGYSTQALYIKLAALLQAKLGPVAARSELTACHVKIALDQGDTVFYEPEWDLLVQHGGWVLFSDTDLIYLAEFGLIAGARYSLAHAFYSGDAYVAGESRSNPNTPTHRLGPVLGYRFESERERFAKPTLLLLVNWWLSHRYRAGQDVHQGIPYVVLAFSFGGTLVGGSER